MKTASHSIIVRGSKSPYDTKTFSICAPEFNLKEIQQVVLETVSHHLNHGMLRPLVFMSAEATSNKITHTIIVMYTPNIKVKKGEKKSLSFDIETENNFSSHDISEVIKYRLTGTGFD